MKCYLCGQYFYIKRDLLTLFKSKKEYVCNKCIKKYPIELNFTPVDLDKYCCVILSIFKKRNYIDYNVFYKEYSKIFISNFIRDGFKTIFLEHIKLDDNLFEELDIYSKLLKSNLIVLCLTQTE